jgi:hypothetical protein
MACDEILVHGSDIANTLHLAYTPPPALCELVLRRLFPWAPKDVDPWQGLLWANGRRPLDDLAIDPDWVWHCAPLSDWDGSTPRWDSLLARVAEPEDA